MSQNPLTTNIVRVERSLFHSIRKECVDKGFLPNIMAFMDDAAGVAAYKQAITDIRNQRGYAIEVFNNSNPQAKELKKVPRIVIITRRSLPGAIGAGPERHYTLEESGHYTVKNLPAQTTDFEIEVRLVTNSAKQQRVLKGILALSLPKRGYITDYENIDQKYLVLCTQQRLELDNELGIIEDVYLYNVPDIYETEDLEPTIDGIVTKINEIDVNTDINDGSANSTLKVT